MELQFCPLFSGSSGNALYVGCDGARLLIDAGVSGAKIERELQSLGVGGLTAILITHEHTDHIGGVGVLSRRYDLPVYATGATWSAMRERVGAIAPKNVREFEAGEDFCFGRLCVQSFSTPHDAADPVGYSFLAGACKLTVATDIGAVKSTWLRYAEGSGAVLLEANHDRDMLRAGRYPYELKRRILGSRGHLSNDEAASAAVKLAASGAKALLLGHLSAENNYPELAFESVASALREAGAELGGDVALSVASRDRHGELIALRG